MSQQQPPVGETYRNKANDHIVLVLEPRAGDEGSVRLARGIHGAGRPYRVGLASFHNRYEPWPEVGDAAWRS